MRRVCQIICFAIFSLTFIVGAQADKRVALVVGNADYQNVVALGNPVNDAKAIAASLTRLGFAVTSQSDLGFDDMRKALRDFSSVARGADIALIYFAGHGMEIGGENYLIPIDARLATDGDVPYEAISLDLALSALDGATGTRLLLLDACRNNPFAAKMHVSADKARSIGRGLARVEPSVGTLVAYAAKEGTTAEDGDTGHSPFARALLEHIEEPGIDVQFLFRKVRDSVLAETNGDQEPFTYGSLPGREVYLKPEAAPAPVAAAAPVPEATPAPPSVSTSVPSAGDELAVEVAFWNSIKDSNDRALLESYLKQYPTGRFASLATIFISRLDAKAAPPAPVADATAPPSPPTPLAATPAPGTPAPANSTADAGQPEAKTPAVPDRSQVAVLPPGSSEETPSVPSPDLILDIQKELVRVGCDVEMPSGKWGRQSRSALHDFIRYADLNPGPAEPTEDYLTALKGRTGRVCPLTCGPRFEVQGDQCILKSCPGRMMLNGAGDCEALKPAIKHFGGGTGAVASGSRCHMETTEQCADRLSNLDRARNGNGRTDDLAVQTACTNPSRRIEICR